MKSEKTFSCSFCKQQTDNLLILQCKHSPCLHCSNSLLSKQNKTQQISPPTIHCSICHSSTTIVNKSVIEILSIHQNKSKIKKAISPKLQLSKKSDMAICISCLTAVSNKQNNHILHKKIELSDTKKIEQFWVKTQLKANKQIQNIKKQIKKIQSLKQNELVKCLKENKTIQDIQDKLRQEFKKLKDKINNKHQQYIQKCNNILQTLYHQLCNTKKINQITYQSICNQKHINHTINLLHHLQFNIQETTHSLKSLPISFYIPNIQQLSLSNIFNHNVPQFQINHKVWQVQNKIKQAISTRKRSKSSIVRKAISQSKCYYDYVNI